MMHTVSRDAVGTTRAGGARARMGVATGTTAWHPAFAEHAIVPGGKWMLTATRSLQWTALRAPHARVPPSLRSGSLDYGVAPDLARACSM